ncbi:MAG: sulfite exporter TauE/SafE family protein [Microthrixaceae bacterium]
MELSDVALVALTVLVGFGAGVLSALLGVGGAVITTPAVRLLGATPIEAVGSTVPAILPGAISGTLRYAREGLVEWRVALSLGIAGAVFALGGALTSDLVDGRLLMVLTAALMLWSGISVARGGRRAAPASPPAAVLVAPPETAGVDELLEGVEASETDSALAAVRSPGPDPGPATAAGTDPAPGADPPEPDVRRPLLLLAGVGALSGFVAGLLGVGGGIVMVPVMTGPLRIPMRSAVASSLVAVAIFSVPALVTHAVLGHIDWLFAVPLMVGVVPGARVGAHITVGASDRTIRRAFGVLIVIVALIYGGTEAAALF